LGRYGYGGRKSPNGHPATCKKELKSTKNTTTNKKEGKKSTDEFPGRGTLPLRLRKRGRGVVQRDQNKGKGWSGGKEGGSGKKTEKRAKSVALSSGRSGERGVKGAGLVPCRWKMEGGG